MPSDNTTYGATNFVTGMRAWAAIGVVLIHAGGAGLRDLGTFGNRIVDFGSSGVYAFFVISGFCVCYSYLNASNFKAYIVKRLLRIALLYFLFILIFGIYIEASFENIALHLLFLSWIDQAIANSILSVEWSIPVEVFWYFLIPGMLVTMLKGLRYCAALLAISFISYLLCYIIISILEISPLSLHWSPFQYFFIFALGVCVFVFRKKYLGLFYDLCNLKRETVSNAAIILVLIAFVSHWVFPILSPLMLVGVSTAFLIFFVNNGSMLSEMLFGNRLIQYLGKVSYSIYLWHFIVIGYLRENSDYKESGLIIFSLSFFLTIGLSSLTYYIVEKPSIYMGRHIGREKFNA